MLECATISVCLRRKLQMKREREYARSILMSEIIMSVNVAVELSMSLTSVAGFGASTGTVREDDGYFAGGLLVVQIAEG